ncbi:MAG: DUF3617 domain-containing protein [Herbaspirillum sp.]
MRSVFAALMALSMMVGINLNAQAAGPMQAGLWEMATDSDLIRLLPSFTPEQIQQMHAFGIDVPPSRDGALLARVCITPAMAEREQPTMLAPNDFGCQSKNFQHQGNDYSVDMVCDSQKMSGHGKLEGRFASNRQFTATLHFNGLAYDQPVNQTLVTNGRWLSADCGDVKPIQSVAGARDPG